MTVFVSQVRRHIKCIAPLILLAPILAGCQGPEIGRVLVKTDAQGKMASVSMRTSTGNPKADARVMTFARTTFAFRVPKALPNHSYIYPVTGDPKNSVGGVRVNGF